MAEGRTKAYYVSDILKMASTVDGSSIPAAFVVDVPNNLFAQAELGWSATPPTGTPPGIKLPRRLKMRHGVGVNSSGKRVKVNIATASASLYGDATGTWTYIDNFGATQTASATGYVGESATV